jgi:hypothetical protein
MRTWREPMTREKAAWKAGCICIEPEKVLVDVGE